MLDWIGVGVVAWTGASVAVGLALGRVFGRAAQVESAARAAAEDRLAA